MVYLDVLQGTPQWAAARAKHFTASEAPAAAGVCKYLTRADLLRQKATGVAPDVSPHQQALFDRGHAAERAACPMAEDIIGDMLYPRTAVAEVGGLPLLASLDGVTEPMSPEEPLVLWEHKLWSEALAEDVRAGTLQPHYTVQMDQQLLVTGASKCLFMVSDGTPERMVWCWYESSPEKQAQLVQVWRQFAADLAAYVPPAVPVAAAPVVVEQLPSVSVRLDGAVAVASNLDKFGESLRVFVDRIPKAPATDEDFGLCDAACKVLEEAETRLKAAVDGALASIAPVEELRRVAGDLLELARSTRLANGKLVTRRKDEIKAGIVACARSAWADHLAGIEATIAPAKIGHLVTPDFILAAKNKRTLATLSDAVQTELARAKVQANQLAEAIGAKLALYREVAAGFEFLFADLYTLLHKDGEAFELLVRARIAEHQQAQQRKAEEAAAAQASKLAEEERMRAERHADSALPPSVPFKSIHSYLAGHLPPTPEDGWAAPAVVPIRQRPEEPATLRLADVQARLGFALPALFITDVLGLPLKRDGASWRTSESGFAAICAALVRHVQKAAFRHVDVSQERAL